MSKVFFIIAEEANAEVGPGIFRYDPLCANCIGARKPEEVEEIVAPSDLNENDPDICSVQSVECAKCDTLIGYMVNRFSELPKEGEICKCCNQAYSDQLICACDVDACEKCNAQEATAAAGQSTPFEVSWRKGNSNYGEYFFSLHSALHYIADQVANKKGVETHLELSHTPEGGKSNVLFKWNNF